MLGGILWCCAGRACAPNSQPSEKTIDFRPFAGGNYLSIRSNHTQDKLFGKNTINRVLSCEDFAIVLASLDACNGSENARSTTAALMLQATQVGQNQLAVPEPILKRISDQARGRAKALGREPTAAERAAMEVCGRTDGATMTGPEVAQAKAAYIRSLIAPQMGDRRAEEG